jgi:hypothetical protein
LLGGRYPASSLIRARPSGSRRSPHFASRLARLPCFRGFSPRGEEPIPASTHGLARVLPPFTPPGGFPADRFRENLLASPKIGRLDTRVALHEVSTGRSLIVAARALAHPALRLCRWASPPGSPTTAPPKLCGFDLLPLQDFHLMDPWVPPGITNFSEGLRLSAPRQTRPEHPLRPSTQVRLLTHAPSIHNPWLSFPWAARSRNELTAGRTSAGTTASERVPRVHRRQDRGADPRPRAAGAGGRRGTSEPSDGRRGVETIRARPLG